MSDSTAHCMLLDAICAQDAESVEDALDACFSEECADSLVPPLVVLLKADWHFRHEDVALLLQRIRSPAAVADLAKAAQLKFGYLGYDNSLSFARKCIWALADTGTQDARESLCALADSSGGDIAALASKRLERWDAEAARKAHG